MAKKQEVGAATRLRDLAETARELPMFDPRKIRVEEGHNPRNYELAENRAHLDELKASIQENGVQQALLVRFEAGQAILVDGECRLRACLELLQEKAVPEEFRVPTIQVKANNEIDRLVIALTANTGKSLSKWEIGTAFRKLEKYGLNPETIAKKMGQSVRFVNEALTLSDAPEEVKQQLSEQAITPSLALTHIKKHGATKAKETLKAAVKEAKAAGKKTATAERTIGVNQWEKVARQLLDSVEADFLKFKDEYEELNVRVPFIKKLFDLKYPDKTKPAKKSTKK